MKLCDVVAARYRDSAEIIPVVVIIVPLRWHLSFCSRHGRIVRFLLLLLLFLFPIPPFLLLPPPLFLFLSSTTPVNRSDSRSRRDYRYRFNQRQAKYYSILRASLPILRLTVYYLCVKCKISIFSSFFFFLISRSMLYQRPRRASPITARFWEESDYAREYLTGIVETLWSNILQSSACIQR